MRACWRVGEHIPVLSCEGEGSSTTCSCSTGQGPHGPRRNTPAPAKIRRTEARKKGERRGNGGAAHQEADGERREVEVVGDEQTVLGEARRSSGAARSSWKKKKELLPPVRSARVEGEEEVGGALLA